MQPCSRCGADEATYTEYPDNDYYVWSVCRDCLGEEVDNDG